MSQSLYNGVKEWKINMAPKTQQHKDKKAYIRYKLDGKIVRAEVKPPTRAEGERFSSGSLKAIQQRVFAGVCQLWSNFHENYFMEAISWVRNEVIPRLPKGYTDLEFRVDIVDSQGKVIGGSGSLDKNGDFIKTTRWASWDSFVKDKLPMRNTSLMLSKMTTADSTPIEPVAPVSFGWMTPETESPKTKSQKTS